jgi:hypothetical protein
MPYTTPTVNYCATLDGTYTSLTGIQSVSINRGRQRFSDNFTPTNAVIDLIPAATYAVPLAVGQFIDIRTTNSASSPAYFVGTITDVERQYAMPYNTVSGVAPADRITITATGATGAMAKNTLSQYAIVNTDCTTSIGQLGVDILVRCDSIGGRTALTRNSTNILSEIGAFDLVNQLLRTCQFFVDDLDNLRTTRTTFYGTESSAATTYAQGQGNTTYTFTDTGSNFAFADIQFISSVQNTFTQAQVTSTGLIPVQTASNGPAPYNTLVYDTYSESSANAASLAAYIIAMQSITTPVPYSITTNTMTTPTCTDISLLSTTAVYIDYTAGMNLGATVSVTFRGATSTATIQGINTTFYPDYATVQLFLSPSLGTAFTLNSSVTGVLDTNRLGFP